MPYTPSRFNGDSNESKDILDYCQREFDAIAKYLAEVDQQVLYAEPKGAEDGQTYFADGTKWNPGAGRGLYLRDGGSWTKIS